MNALEDKDITRALYQAAMKGVKIDLIVRDTCRIRPGIRHISDNVRVISIVGRFLKRNMPGSTISETVARRIFHRLRRLHDTQSGTPG